MMQLRQPQQQRPLPQASTGLCMDAGGKVAATAEDEATTALWFPSFTDPAMAALVHNNTQQQQQQPNRLIRITQATAPWAQLSHSFRLTRKLGNGSFGTAYLCRLNEDIQPTPAYGRVFVIKLPNVSLAADARAHARGALTVDRRVHSVLRSQHPHPQQQQQQQQQRRDKNNNNDNAVVVRDFEEEMHNAERMLEPSCLFRLRAQRTGTRRVGAPLEGLTPREYFQYLHELRFMHAHVGRHHMHQVLHFSASVPAIISEHADGTLEGLQFQCMMASPSSSRRQSRPSSWLDVGDAADTTADADDVEADDRSSSTMTPPPPRLWTLIAAQLAEAMDYMRTHTPLAHADLKPANILYRVIRAPPPPPPAAAASASNHPKHPPPQQPHPWLQCLVSDYGICFRKAHAVEPYTPSSDENNCHFPGTPLYNPFPNERNAVWMGPRRDAAATTMQSLSYYQFFSTLADLLRFRAGTGAAADAEADEAEERYYFMRWAPAGESVAQALALAHGQRGHHVRRLYAAVAATARGRDGPLFVLLHTLLFRDAPARMESGFDRFRAAIRRQHAATFLLQPGQQQHDPVHRAAVAACARAAADAATYAAYAASA